MRLPDVSVFVHIVPHGYEFEVTNRSRVNESGDGVERRGWCRDFGDDYDPTLIADVCVVAFAEVMRNIEDKLKKAKAEGTKS